MKKIVIEGNAVYEMDEACLKKREEKEKKETKKDVPELDKKKGCD